MLGFVMRGPVETANERQNFLNALSSNRHSIALHSRFGGLEFFLLEEYASVHAICARVSACGSRRCCVFSSFYTK